MLINLQLNCDLNSNIHLSFDLRFGIVWHFLYIVRWKEQLHFSTMVTFPPVEWGRKCEQSCWFCVRVSQVYADEHAWCRGIKLIIPTTWRRLIASPWYSLLLPMCVCMDSPSIVLLWYIVYQCTFTEVELIRPCSLVTIYSPNCIFRLKETNTNNCEYLYQRITDSQSCI